MKLSPHDTDVPFWEYTVCHLHSHLAQWEKALPYCQQALAASPQLFLARADIVAANAWLGRDAETKASLGELLKANPRFTVKSFITIGTYYSDNSVYSEQVKRIAEGLRKAGVPEE